MEADPLPGAEGGPTATSHAPSGAAAAAAISPSPTVTLSSGSRGEGAAHIRLEEFDGPLALLLSLIEQRQLDVLTVPLGALAGAYLDAIARLEGPRLAHLSSFVSIAAQLILIKSRALLPSPPAEELAAPGEEGPDPEAELRDRLLQYRAYRGAGRWLGDRAEGGRLFRREVEAAQAAGVAGAHPSGRPPLDPGALIEALLGLAALAAPAAPEPELLRREITLAERAEAIRSALRHARVVVLQELLGDIRDRTVVAVTFLAVLELVKRREIEAVQDEPWGPIRCRAVPGAVPAAGAIDERLDGYA